MRSLVKILLVFYLFRAFVPEWVIEELGKIPELAQHYQEHKEQTPDLEVISFLAMHYGKGFFEHKFDHDHSGLPLKHHSTDHHHIITIAFGTPETCPDWAIQLPVLPGEDSAGAFPEPQCLPSISIGGIFQPPKTA